MNCVKMSAYVSKRISLPSTRRVEEETPKMIQKQGIVSILGSDCENTKFSSLRRTLSADMSSKKWLAQNGLLRIASSEELVIPAEDSSLSSEVGEDNNENKKLSRSGQLKDEKPGQLDIWSSILCQKSKEDSSKLPPPYIHPLVKKSSSALNEKSLEVCTESLGSETGSDGFSSYQASDNGDAEEENKNENEEIIQQEEKGKELNSFDIEELKVVKYHYSTSKRSSTRSFPPLLSSFTSCNGPSLQMHSHRENGRLVVEAVTASPRKYFRAQRQEGRLVLTLINGPEVARREEMEEKKIEEFETLFDDFETSEENEIKTNDEEVEEEEEEEEEEEIIERVEKEIGFKESNGVINVHRSVLIMKQLMENPTWPHKFNKAVAKLVEVEEEEPAPLPQSLPLAPRVARSIPSLPAAGVAASLNAYEYFWRTPSVGSAINPITEKCPPIKNNYNKVILNRPKVYEQQDLVLLRGDDLVPVLNGCKEPRRTLLIWQPNCITSS